MSIFGDLERLLADLYPYRIPLTIGGLLAAAAVATLIVRRGWHRPVLTWADGNRLAAASAAVLFLAVTLPAGYYLVSPLWERTTLIEASPLDVAVPASSTAGPATDPTAAATTGPDTSGGASASATSPAGEPTVTPATPTAAPTDGGPQLVSRGAFSGADDFHFANGDALIIETAPGEFLLRFESFSIRNGPDLFVYLSSSPDAPSDDGIRLGELKATDGAFNYELPPGTDIGPLQYAMVWCDQFAVLFATAPLQG